jgi:hypothetical protein
MSARGDVASRAAAARRCRSCGRELSTPSDTGWECECGVAVCTSAECFEEFFKAVADGEATRCRTCGAVT